MTLPDAPKPGYIAAFSTVEKAAAFMFKRGDTDWRMTLVSRPTFPRNVENLQLLGVRGLCFDQTEETPGTFIDFDQIDHLPLP